MPNEDGTGPDGKGPKTGRQMGKCKGAEPVGNESYCGRRHGRGRGRNARNK